MSQQTPENDAPFFVSARVESALTEAARAGRDINIAGALYRKVNHGAGRCGDESPRIVTEAKVFCCLPYGHLGWHRGDDDSEWTRLIPSARTEDQA